MNSNLSISIYHLYPIKYNKFEWYIYGQEVGYRNIYKGRYVKENATEV